jgi:hypothetical protein
MGPEGYDSTTLFRSTIYVFPFVAQGLNEIVMMTMVIMMITDLATFCYSRARMQEESLPRPQVLSDAFPLPTTVNTPDSTCPLSPRSHRCHLRKLLGSQIQLFQNGPIAG